MSIKTIARILDNHSIPYFIQNDHIYADSMEAFTPLFSEVIDITDWNRDSIFSLLGY